MSEKPRFHGPDHRPGGPDPIPGIGGGIQFDTAPQAGGWLEIETDDETEVGGAPSGYGIHLHDASAGGIGVETDSAGIDILASAMLQLTGNPVKITGGTTNGVQIHSTTDLTLQSGNSNKIKIVGSGTIERSTTGNIILRTTGASGNVEIMAPNNSEVDLQAEHIVAVPGTGWDGTPSGSPGNFQVSLVNGIFYLYVADPTNPGDPILKVDYDGGTDTATYHIRTGSSWVADL